MRQINKIIKKGENLLKQIGAELNQTKGMQGIPIDIYINDCLGYIEAINKLTNINKKQKEILMDAMIVTIGGISAAMKNTG